jgi:hypothetical protein
MRGERRGPWYLITGLVIGLTIGVLYAWLVSPVNYTNTSPASLRADFKDQYRTLIAAAYMANGDLVRAKARLNLLKDEDVYRTLSEQAQRTLAEGRYPQEARALGLLAIALGQAPPTVALASPAQTMATSPQATVATLPAITSTQGADQSGTPASIPTRTRTPATQAPTFTPLPTRTATATQGAPFILEREDLVCEEKIKEPLIQVIVQDAAGQPVPGMQVIVTWEGGEERFFTGLKPELGLGYADFTMQPDTAYALRLASGGQPPREIGSQPVLNLIAAECEAADGSRYLGSWRLVFVQP